jgi:hypothetical protein
MTEFFGYERTGASAAQIISSEFATVSLQGGAVSLVQSVNGVYQQQVRPVMSIGDPNIYWVTGHPQGNVSMQRMCGKTGFLSAFKGGKCGRIDTVMVNATKGQICADGAAGGGRAVFAGGMLEQVGFAMRAGQTEIFENASIRVASLSTG